MGSPEVATGLQVIVWEQFYEDVNKVLEAPVKGEVDQRLWMMMTISTSLAQERFCAEEKRPAQQTYTMNRQAAMILKIHQELKTPRKQYKGANEEQCPPLAEL